MQIPQWYQNKFFPEGYARNSILDAENNLKRLGDMQEADRGPTVDIFSSLRRVEEILAVMREPVLARALELPCITTLLPDKYHVYRHIPPYYAQLWYRRALDRQKVDYSYSDDSFVIDFITLLILEFPWEQQRGTTTRTSDKGRQKEILDAGTYAQWVYLEGTLKAVSILLHSLPLPASPEYIAKVFVSRFIWYCNMLDIDALEYDVNVWDAKHCSSVYDFNSNSLQGSTSGEPVRNLGVFGGFMLHGFRQGRLVLHGAVEYKQRVILQRLTLMILLFVTSQPAACMKIVLEGLMTFSTLIQGVWLVPILEPILKEVNAECQ